MISKVQTMFLSAITPVLIAGFLSAAVGGPARLDARACIRTSLNDVVGRWILTRQPLVRRYQMRISSLWSTYLTFTPKPARRHVRCYVCLIGALSRYSHLGEDFLVDFRVTCFPAGVHGSRHRRV
ncbi:hypothetical protein P171DRAFT_291548 [Karstenula rhodostoma CBS 690.94]|uniref:Uncharacterized protein n=1 Tax=Karstenula rhodostoma CBS 690.94 TaxID=1392251 RepID=A0A9P4UB49_9PLEO|nr:hypothetical protein P171DRAFT_291548 [Karstenula rhodostoma CBS 690.94]